jgi:prefoldin subunit 5
MEPPPPPSDDVLGILQARASMLRAEVSRLEAAKKELAKIERMIGAAKEPEDDAGTPS